MSVTTFFDMPRKSNIVGPTGTPVIFVPTATAEQKSIRDELKRQWGDKYPRRITQWTSMIRAKMMKAPEMGPYEAAKEFMGLLKARKKLHLVLKNTITAAAVEVEEGNYELGDLG